MDWLKLIESTQHCQRNWNFDKVIDEKTIDWLFDVGYTMPTKQNKDSIQIIAFKTRELVELVSKHAYDQYDHAKHSGHKNNPQTNAPVLFGFLPIFHNDDKYVKAKSSLEIGLAAGAMALAANSIGMKTGFCQCFENDWGWSKTELRLLKRKNVNIGDINLLVGMGYPIETQKHNIDNTGREHDTYPKISKLPIDKRKIIF